MLSSVSVMGSGFITDRFGSRRTVTASFVGTGSGMLLLMAITALALGRCCSLLFVPVFGLCMGMRGPIISSICTRHFAGPKRGDDLRHHLSPCNALGAAFGSLMGGVLHDLSGGYVAGLCFSLVFIALASMPFWTVPALSNYR